MLTGVETAGLVLAVLPLFISAFEHYNDGLEPIKAFWDIDRLLPIQIRRLRNQHVHYEQTLRILLAQIVDRNEVEEMIAAPNSDIWKTPDMQERLELVGGFHIQIHHMRLAAAMYPWSFAFSEMHSTAQLLLTVC